MNEKIIALTFDDGPSIGITDAILDILEENDAKASFFLIGDNIKTENEYLIKRAYNMGCTIENHTKTHPSMITLSKDEIQYEVDWLTDKIIEIVGEKPEFFRPPFIDYNQLMFDTIEFPFICGHGCEDWVKEIDAQTRYERVISTAADGQIVLLHDMDGNEATVEAVRNIVDTLGKQGYKFVTIRELFKLKGVTPVGNVIYSAVDETFGVDNRPD